VTARAAVTRRRRKKLPKKHGSKSREVLSTNLPDDEQRVSPGGIFIASERQQRFVESLMSFDGPKFSIKAVCKTAGITRQVFYKWRQRQDFVTWLNGYRKPLSDADIIFIDKVVNEIAKRGDLAAAKLVYQRRGELKVDVDLSGSIRVEKNPEVLGRLLTFLRNMTLPPGVQALQFPDTQPAQFEEVANVSR